MNNGRHPDLGDPEQEAILQHVIAQQVAPPITPANQKLEDGEVLKIENMYLKLQNMQLQVQNLDRTKADLIDQMRAQQKELEEYRASLSQKYNADISRTNVTPDGHILRPGQPLPSTGS